MTRCARRTGASSRRRAKPGATPRELEPRGSWPSGSNTSRPVLAGSLPPRQERGGAVTDVEERADFGVVAGDRLLLADAKADPEALVGQLHVHAERGLECPLRRRHSIVALGVASFQERPKFIRAAGEPANEER